MKAIVVAIGKKNEIGTGSDMPWSRALPDDLKHFSSLTRGNTIIMGRGTFEHDMRSKPLPSRDNIVLTSKDIAVEGVHFVSSLTDAYKAATGDVFVIGGGKLYASALPTVDVLYVTEIDADFPDASVFFPEISSESWKEVSRDHHDADERNAYSFDFVTYERIRP